MSSNHPELELKLFVRNIAVLDESDMAAEELRERKEEVVNRLETLEDEGMIEQYDVFEKEPKRVSTSYRNATTGYQKAAVERYDEFQRWATRHGFTLQPFFDERPLSPRTEDSVFFPDMYLVAREERKLQGVFPCSDGETEYSIGYYLSALEEGRDWEHYDSAASLTTPDYGAHGAIKAHIKENLSSVAGEEWVEAEDEYAVESERRGQIDLLCRHEDRRRYLLIEVKPKKDKDEIDKAFGQILRYKYQFIADRNIPDLTPDEIELAIAAPEFYDFHHEAAKQVGIRLITVA